MNTEIDDDVWFVVKSFLFDKKLLEYKKNFQHTMYSIRHANKNNQLHPLVRLVRTFDKTFIRVRTFFFFETNFVDVFMIIEKDTEPYLFNHIVLHVKNDDKS